MLYMLLYYQNHLKTVRYIYIVNMETPPKKSVGRPRLSDEERKKRRAAYARKVYHKYSDRRKEMVECECGMMVCRAGLISHKNRSLHANNMALIEKLKKKYETCIPIIKDE